jgi:hypothetical protein
MAGVVHHRLDFRAVAGDPFRGQGRFAAVDENAVGQALGKGADLFGQRPTAQQQRAFDRPQPPSLPAFQAYRRGQAEGPDHAPADGRIGEVDITVRHGTHSG